MDGEVLNAIVQVSLLVFVVSSMLAMGLSLTVGQIVEPLRSVRLVLIALAANFIAVPPVGWGIGELLSLDEGLAIGLTIMATAAGAPFLPKLAAAAHGDMAFSVGLMVLLMVVTVGYMPIVLPVLIEGVDVDPAAIASSLIFLMLLPLAIGLGVRWRYESMAEGLQPLMTQTSTIAIAALLGAGVIVNFDDIVDLIGTGGFIAILVFLAISGAIGYVGGGSEPGTRSVLGLGTAQRNLSAALVVGGQNFADTPGVITFIIVAGIVGLIVLLPAAGEIGKRTAPTA
jgi:BASS family bile acid:Na+ symporter